MRVSVRSLVRAPVAAGNMAALMSLSQLSSGSLVYETYYRQVDRGNTGRVGPTEAALFLKKSELSDSTLGKIWELADPDGKGYLDKQGFFVALRLVACAQNGKDVSIASLSLPVTPPNLGIQAALRRAQPHSPVTPIGPSGWRRGGSLRVFLKAWLWAAVCDMKPVLMNSKLPLDVLGRIWDLSDIDKDGHLDKDEFAVAMHLVYRAMEKEPVPFSLPPSLIPPSKRKKGGTLPGSVPVLPLLAASPSFLKESLQSTSSHGSISSLNSTGSLSPKPSLKSTQVPPKPSLKSTQVPPNRASNPPRYPQTKPQIHPGTPKPSLKSTQVPQTEPQIHPGTPKPSLKSTQVPPNRASNPPRYPQTKPQIHPDRGRYDELFLKLDSDLDGLVGGAEVKEVFMQSGLPQTMLAHVWTLADTRQKGKLTREQFSLAMHLIQQKREVHPGTGNWEKEEAIRLKTNDVQEKQSDLDQESSGLQDLETQKQDAQVRLEEMDQQKSKLGTMLEDVQLKCQEEAQKISSVQVQIQAQESDVQSQEDELNRAKADLTRLQQEEAQLEQSIKAGQSQLDTITRSLRVTQDEINQARSRLAQIRDSQEEVTRTIEQCNAALNGGA
ncbi:hypothetical protein ANANG_G00132530 [Anguilla anguilla]|uniref:Epidermal growth factor receptor pathway substrate 15 like 1 n=1 Tax=Anguilla anguilla TaxID=7936 RepID=A0A9D3MHD2_ANGAN|nr:hypothetical protein ANANG_G00132530 [Anguilla anguilla]